MYQAMTPLRRQSLIRSWETACYVAIVADTFIIAASDKSQAWQWKVATESCHCGCVWIFINEEVNEPINCICLSSQIWPGGYLQLNSSIQDLGGTSPSTLGFCTAVILSPCQMPDCMRKVTEWNGKLGCGSVIKILQVLHAFTLSSCWDAMKSNFCVKYWNLIFDIWHLEILNRIFQCVRCVVAM